MKDTKSSAGKNSATSSSNNNNNAPPAGIQLLSPASLQVARSTGARQPSAKGFGASRVTTASGADFDFNSFTLESVRSTMGTHTTSSNCSTGSGSSSSAATTASSSTITTNNKNTNSKAQRKVSTASSDDMSCLSSQAEKFADALDAQPSVDGTSSFHTMRSTEDFDALEHRRRNPSAVSSGVSVSVGQTQAPAPPSSKQSASSSSLAAAPERGGVARKKTTVVMKGWLQKRKGLVLKRWKAYFCLLRDDDQLCLYASEDTINGRVEQRVQVLRVLLTDKSDAFHVIGVSGDGTPRKDEFRALHSVDWCSWFRALRGYLDAVSLQDVMHRKPELSELSAASSRDSGNDKFSAVGPMPGSKSSSKSNNQQQHHHHHQQQQQHISDQQRKSFATRGSFDLASIEELLAARSTLSTTMSAFSGVSSWTNQSGSDDAKVEASGASDCPVVEPREPHLAMLDSEHQRVSESTASRDSDVVQPSAFSW